MKSLVARAMLALSMAAVFGAAARAQQPQSPAPSSPAQTAPRCRVTGRVTSANTPLPGVSLAVHAGDTLKAATSTDIDGTYTILFAPNAAYHLSADFTGFVGAGRDVVLGAAPCDQTVDFHLSLEARDAVPTDVAAAAEPADADVPPATSTPDANPTRRGGGGGGRTAAAGSPGDARTSGANGRFQRLDVQADSTGAALDVTPAQEADDVTRHLPSGFSLEGVEGDAVAITGSNAATNLDRALMDDRLQMINLGQLDPSTGQSAPGFGSLDPSFLRSVGRRGFAIGGRGARGQRPYQGSATYTFGGSILDSPPFQLRRDVPATQPQFAQNTVGGTFGGFLKVPGLYANADRRTNVQVNYTANRTSNVFDQYATVPTDAERSGNFSSSAIQLIDPASGRPFPGNQIPASRIDPGAATLMRFIPRPNLPGTTQNYHLSTTAHSSSEALTLRVTQNFSRTAGQGSSGPGRSSGGPGPGRGTNVVLNAQVQYRRKETQALNVFPDLSGNTTNTRLTAPILLNVRHGRSLHNFGVNLTHAVTETSNAFANSENIAALAGIHYPGVAATDPLNWGVPNLVFTGFTPARSSPASLRIDNRLTAGYAWMHPASKHQLRIGGDYRIDESSAPINTNSRGTFTFTGTASTDGGRLPAGAGPDFADFLLGLPQQATLQAGGSSRLRQQAFAAYIEDNWQKSPKLTFNLGVRYELAMPYVEVSQHLANLDVAPDFSRVAPVLPGGIGPYTGAFPPGLLNTDKNNVGPRLGVAYRVRPTIILRGGYSITYNSGSYASIARQLTGQPPFADTETITAGDGAPLTLAEALLSTPPPATNNWGVDRDYALGMIQTWNATVTKNVTNEWVVQARYTGIKGSDLDILRAPALGPGGVLIPGAQAFIWESSGGHSRMNAGTLEVRRRLADGYSGGLSYTVAKAFDNTSSLGAGGPIVAQNDKDLDAEWALSSFDRRHQLSGDLYVELPWGPNRHWLKDGGRLAAVFGEWSAQITMTLQSGTPLTARVLGAASDLLRGVNGSLRASYTGAPITLSDPTVDEFFNVAAFSAPVPGRFGDSSRNVIPGPGAHQLNGLFERDLRLGGHRSLTLQVDAMNLLNSVQWAAVDTNINSPTFGHVLSARPMRTMTVTARLRF